MSDSNELFFVDGIANLSYSAGAFRFDLATLKPSHKKKDKDKMEVDTRGHVVMTPQAFIQTCKAMENFVKMVEEKGIIRFNEQANETVEAEKV